MTPSVAIVGKQTVQRISIRFPKREGQSRISIRFQAVERGCSHLHGLLTLARPLLKNPQKSKCGCAKVFHVNLQHSSDAFEYVSGVIRDVGKAVQRIGKIVHERH